MKKIIIIVVFLLTNIVIFGVCFSPGFSQAQDWIVQPQLVKGNIVDVNFVGSTITIKYLQSNGNNDEITLKVTAHTIVDKGDLRISLTDVKEGDEVVVEYYEDLMSLGAPKIIQINVIPLTK